MTWERYKSVNTGFETVDIQLGPVADFRSYCDDPTIGPVGIYVNKAPVCKLSLTPKVQFPNVNIVWDISDSISSVSTIQTFDIEWGGTTDIGDLNAQSWSLDPKAGNVQYTGVGIYTVTAWVTQISTPTESNRVKITIEIVELDEGVQRVYIGTTDGGLYIDEPGSTPTASNTGLTGNHPNFRALRMHPAYKDLPTDQQHLWACTQDGLAYSVDGGQNWSLITKTTLGTPTNDAADDPAPATADLDQIDISFDPQDDYHLIVYRSTATRIWVYESFDYGLSWSNYQIGIGGSGAITIANETAFYSGAFGVGTPEIVKVDTGIGVGLIVDTDTAEIIGKVITATSGISVGTEQQIDDGSLGKTLYEAIERPGVNGSLFIVTDSSTSGKLYSRAITRSGDTLTEQTEYEIDSNYGPVKTGIATNGTPMFMAFTTQALNDLFIRTQISGTTLTPDTPVAADTAFGTQQQVVGLNLTDFMFCFLDTNDLKFQIIQAASSSYTQGTISDSTENASSAKMVRLDADKCLVAFVDSDDSTLKLMTVNRSSTSISGYGSPLSIGTFSIYALKRLSATQVLVCWVDTGDLKSQTYSISGDTVTADGNVGSLTPVSDINTLSLAILDTDIAVAIWKDSPDDAYVARLSGFGVLDYGFTHSTGGIPGVILVTS